MVPCPVLPPIFHPDDVTGADCEVSVGVASGNTVWYIGTLEWRIRRTGLSSTVERIPGQPHVFFHTAKRLALPQRNYSDWLMRPPACARTATCRPPNSRHPHIKAQRRLRLRQHVRLVIALATLRRHHLRSREALRLEAGPAGFGGGGGGGIYEFQEHPAAQQQR
ncbi:hypothetical protein SKAU_G00182710 [Synaphobranchus kaupii]|uniref:Uncharacterized protein n=1 Tax=Synaphobranchus kaupii TaxID=118154 RepID=A0A9Q1IUE1_SYNKA|nr:hypothetical protein SKAU_G00182710 [Synaphobranchus kaupii]